MSRHPLRNGGRLRRRVPLSLALAALLAVTVVAVPALASHDNSDPNPATTTIGEQPEQKPGNDSESCDVGEFFFRIEGDKDGGSDADLESGAYPAPGGAVFNLQVPTDGPIHVGDPKTLDFWVDGGSVAEVRLKGGPNGYNEYDYVDHSDGNTDGETFTGLVNADDYLHSPPGPQPGTFGGLSHISFCYDVLGQLKVQKFIDVDADGELDEADVTSGDANLNGWLFNVYEGDSTDAADFITQLSTGDDNDGMTETIDLAAGQYTVEEVNTGKTITTAVTGGSTTELTSDGDATLDNQSTKDVVAGELTTYTFGNACLISKTFEVTNGAGLEGVFVIYDVNDPLNDGDGDHRVDLNGPDADGDWSATVNDILRLDDTVNWTFGALVDGVEQTHPDVQSDVVPAAAGYPSCLDTNTRANAPAEISGNKVKDVNDDGMIQLEEELQGLANFVFELRQGGTPLARAVSDANGQYTFPGTFDAGTYSVHEIGISADGTATNLDADAFADWVQTVPAAGGSQTVVIGLDDTAVTVDTFANAPLSDIGLFFIDRTGFTNVKIICWDANTSPEDPLFVLDPADPDYEDPTPETPVTLEDLRIADNNLTCTFEIIDP